MKTFILIVYILVLVYSTVALKNDICGLKHAQGGDSDIACLAKIPSWSYNVDTDECTFFVYGGCYGNANRFDSLDECEVTCKENV